MWFPTPWQVNGVNIEGLRHSEVVALIQTGGQEARLLVVDLETDELFLRLGVIPSSSHIEGKQEKINRNSLMLGRDPKC